MMLSTRWSLKRCQENCRAIFQYLDNGLDSMQDYIQNLRAGLRGHRYNTDDIYIKYVLLPDIEEAKRDFETLMEHSNEQLQNVNVCLEKSVVQLKNIQDEKKRMQEEKSRLSMELEGKQKAIKTAMEDLNSKNNQLREARNALSIARRKLEEAQDSRDTAHKVAFGLAFIPFINIVAVPVTLIVAGTVLQDAIDEASNRCSSADYEVTYSKRRYDDAVDANERVNQQMKELKQRKHRTDTKLNDLEASIFEQRKRQSDIIDFNEKMKNCYRELCNFYGKFNIIRSETRGGYSLTHLQTAMLPFCTSVNAVLCSPSTASLCDRSTYRSLQSHLVQIESIEWPAIEPRTNFDELDVFI